MGMSEAGLQVLFTRWLRKSGGLLLGSAGAGAFELKLVRCDGRGGKCADNGHCLTRLAASRVSEGQEDALTRAAGLRGSPLVHKISDSAVGYKPFDCFVMTNIPAFVVIGWRCAGLGRPRVYALPVDDWLDWRARMPFVRGREVVKRPGLREKEAMAIGVAVTL